MLARRVGQILPAFFCLIVCSLILSPPARSDNKDIPPGLLPYRDRLLGARQDMLAMRVDENRCQSEDERLIDQVDRLLPDCPEYRDKLLGVKTRRLQCITGHAARLNSISKTISDIDKELVRVESEIKYWATRDSRADRL